MDTKRQRMLSWLLGSLLFLVCVSLVLTAYRFGWTATGFQGKTVWDWLQLLIVPLALALVAIMFNQANTRTERQIAQQRYKHDEEIAQQRYERDQQIALDKQQEDLFQAYLDRISELLLKENLRTSPSEEVRNVARVRTITVLTQLNIRRVSYVFAFLQEAGLMSNTPDSSVVHLKHADLRAVEWGKADLGKANLSGTLLGKANLSGANLSGADLSGARLSYANLSGADLREAILKSEVILFETDLSYANLGKANLSGATITEEQLKKARSLKGTTMPDGSTHA